MKSVSTARLIIELLNLMIEGLQGTKGEQIFNYIDYIVGKNFMISNLKKHFDDNKRLENIIDGKEIEESKLEENTNLMKDYH